MDAEFDWLTLDADEEVVWSETPHPHSLVPAIVVGVPLAIVLVGIVILVGAYLSHKNTNYVVTSDALYKKTGVLSRNVQRIEFDKVQDTSYRQSFLGAHFGYGTVDVSTAGGGGVEMSFSNVAEPLSVQTLINERLRASRGRDDDADRDADEVLAEILAELRAIRSAVARTPDGPTDAHADPDGPGEGNDGDPTGRLRPGDPGDGEVVVDADANGDGDVEPTSDEKVAADAEEVTPKPSSDGTVATDDEATDSDPEEFSFEDRA